MSRTRLIDHTASVLLGQRTEIAWDGNKFVQVPGAPVTANHRRYARCFDVVHSKPFYSGGPLSISKYGVEFSGDVGTYRQDGSQPLRTFTGMLCHRPVISGVQPLQVWTGQEYGAEAWAKAKPGQPGIDLAQSIAELKELPSFILGLQNAFGRATRLTLKDLGDTQLTYWMAVMPLVNDLKNLHKTWKNQEAILAQLVRDNGRPVRRRRKLLKTNSTSTVTLAGNQGYTMGPVDQLYQEGLLTRTTSTSKDVWFSGRFQYYIPDVGTVGWRRRAIRELYGIKPSVRLLWELTPWSWLIDWFISVGDVLGNLEDDLAENLVAHYAFLMASVRTSVREDFVVPVRGQNGRFAPGRSTVIQRWETKSRSVASRYGFGLTLDEDLSPRQIAILGALGLQRIR